MRRKQLGDVIHHDPKHPMAVWRVEGPCGVGPYGVRDRTRECLVEANCYRMAELRNEDAVNLIAQQRGTAHQPGPFFDFESREFAWEKSKKEKYLFGFESPARAIDWFGQDELRRMGKLGWKLRRVPAVRVVRSQSGKQLMFVPTRSYIDSRPALRCIYPKPGSRR